MASGGGRTGAAPGRAGQLALFATAMAWTGVATSIAAQAARGITVRLQVGQVRSLLEGMFLLFLVVLGFRVLDRVGARGRYAAEVLRLPRREGRAGEWGVGAAVGWGLSLVAVVPVLLSGNLHGVLRLRAVSVGALVIGLGTLLVGTLAQEVIFRGYGFQRMAAAFGPSWAAVLMSMVFGVFLVQANPPSHFFVAVVDGTLFGMVLAMAWLRTHGLWLGWGLHFAYRAVAAVVLGLPIAGRGEFESVSDTVVSGPRWLSGGAFGLDAALLTGLVMLGGVAVLYRVTREYAWRYTHPPIVAAGYEVVIAPPAAHVAMEATAAVGPPPLVQILPVTPRGGEGLN